MGHETTLLPGRYVYVGSAHGPGGLRARLGRHLRGDGRPHWHIDVLRAAARVEGYAYWTRDGVTECALAQALASLPGASIPLPHFGASDCRTGCPAHLVALPDRRPLAEMWDYLRPDGHG